MGHVTCFGQLNVTVSLASWVEAFSSLNSQQALFHVPSIEEKFLGLQVPLNGKELPWRAAQPTTDCASRKYIFNPLQLCGRLLPQQNLTFPI